jgi:hypothetical protein
MTISHSQISTPRRDTRLAGASLPGNQSPAPEFLIVHSTFQNLTQVAQNKAEDNFLIATKPPFPVRSGLTDFDRNASIATSRI